MDANPDGVSATTDGEALALELAGTDAAVVGTPACGEGMPALQAAVTSSPSRTGAVRARWRGLTAGT